MKTFQTVLFATLVITGANPSYAGTALFQLQDKSVVTLQGPPGDLDSENLFNKLNTDSVDDNGVAIRHVSFAHPAGNTFLDITCKLSQTVEHFGSCSVDLPLSRYLIRGTRSFVFSVPRDDSNLKAIQLLFSPPDTQDLVFKSTDGKLRIRSEADISGGRNFYIIYTDVEF